MSGKPVQAFKASLKAYTLILLRILIIIGSTILFFMFMRWIGLKGALGLFAGMLAMAYLFLSKNMMVWWLVESFQNEEYMASLLNKNDKSNKSKNN